MDRIIKITGVILCVVVSLCFTACGNNTAESTEAAEPQMGVVNPMQQYTLEDVSADTGLAIDMQSGIFADAVVHKYNLDPCVYQIVFTSSDNNSYCFRIQSATEMTDISGMYYQWNTVVENTEENCTVSTNGEGQGICLWWDGEYAYCISMDENADTDTLTAICKSVKALIKNAK